MLRFPLDPTIITLPEVGFCLILPHDRLMRFSYTFYILVTLGWKWATNSHIWLPPIGDIRSVAWLSPWTSQATSLLLSRGDNVKLVWYLESLLQVFGFIVSNITAQIIHASLSLWICEREYSIFVHDVDSRAELESQFHI